MGGNSIVGSVKTIQGEEIIREYSFPASGSSLGTDTRKAKGPGRFLGAIKSQKGIATVCVTNKRLICRVQGKMGLFDGKDSVSTYQMLIKNVGDVCTATVKRSRVISTILIIAGILTLLMLFGILLILAGIALWILTGRIRTFEARSTGGGSGVDGCGFLVMGKWVTTQGYEEMACEIGALIADLQTYGDDCIHNWKRNSVN